MKTIFDYFEDEIEHPKICNGIILPFNVLYSQVGSSVLDAFINYCKKHLICYTLDYYRNNDAEKEKLIKDININGIEDRHTNLSILQDDVLIISKIENGYMLFWYHKSGRCDIGRFTTNDSIKTIWSSVVYWLEIMKKDNITDYHQILTDKFLKGWVRY